MWFVLKDKTEQSDRMSQQSEMQKGSILRLSKLELDVMQHHYTERSGHNCHNTVQNYIWASLLQMYTQINTFLYTTFSARSGLTLKSKQHEIKILLN